jgi:hypothetical protein
MPQTSKWPLKKRWPKALVLAGVAMVLLVPGLGAVLSSCRTGAPPPMNGVPQTAAVSSAPRAWRVTVPGEMQPAGVPFGGRFALGGTLFVPPGASFEIVTEPANVTGHLIDAAGAEWPRAAVAPQKPGLYRLTWTNGDAPQRDVTLNVVVLTRAETIKRGERTTLKVNGQTLGTYHDPEKSTLKRVRENAARYQIPRFFATLTPETLKLSLGDDFALGQLVAFKDFYGNDGKKIFTTERHTDVLPPRPELIDKLNKLRDRLRAQGVKLTHFWITSGFRTPAYNHSIGGAAYSRHCYGDAADIVIDEDGDKHIDDLNGDGRVDRKDGLIIANACRELEAAGAVVPGGIGVYEWQSDDSVRCHIHIDCRGYVVRWGQIGSGKYRKMFTWWPKSEFVMDEDNGE